MTTLFRLVSLLLVCFILVGCGPKDYALRQQKIDLARAVTDARIQAIENREELNDVTQKMRIMSKEMDASLLEQAKARNVRLRGDVDFDGLAAFSVKRLIDKVAKAEKANRKNRRSVEVLLPRESPMLVSSFADLDNLRASSTFGRMLSDKLASRLNQLGYRTVDVRVRDKILIREGTGELLLSRDLDAIGARHRAHGALVGTYAIGMDEVYITVRVIRVPDRTVLAADNYTIPIGPNTFKMLFEYR